MNETVFVVSGDPVFRESVRLKLFSSLDEAETFKTLCEDYNKTRPSSQKPLDMDLREEWYKHFEVWSKDHPAGPNGVFFVRYLITEIPL